MIRSEEGVDVSNQTVSIVHSKKEIAT